MHKIWTAYDSECDGCSHPFCDRLSFTSRPLYQHGSTHRNREAGIFLGPTPGLEDVEKRKFSCTCTESNSCSLVVQFVMQWQYWGSPARETKYRAIKIEPMAVWLFKALKCICDVHIFLLCGGLYFLLNHFLTWPVEKKMRCSAWHLSTYFLCQLSNTMSTNKCSTWFKPFNSSPF
jgi:hypothetical protein